MGKRLKQRFLQRYPNGQKVYGKMLSIINHRENANQNHNEILSHTLLKKKTENNKC